MAERMDLLRIVKIFSSLAIILWLICFVGLENIASTFTSFKAIYLAPAMGMIFITIFLTALINWILLMKFHKLSFSLVLRNYLISWGLGFLLPGKLGEFSLAAFIKDKADVGTTLACLLMQKLLFLFLIGVFSLAGLAVFFGFSPNFMIPIFFLLAIVAFFALFSTPRGNQTLKKIFIEKFKHGQSFFKSLIALSKDAKMLAVGLSISLLRIFALAIEIGIIFFGFGIQADMFKLSFIVSITTLATFIPFTVSGLGFREGLFVILASNIGIAPEIATTAALLSTALTYVAVLLCVLLSGSISMLSKLR